MLPVRGIVGRLLSVRGGRLLRVPAVFGRLLSVSAGGLLPGPAVLGRLFRGVARVVGGAGLRHEA